MKPEWCPQEVWDRAFDLMDEHCASVVTGDDDAEAVVHAALARAILEAHQRGRREGMEERPVGLSQWSGWDQSRLPWSECKHKDAVLEALFLGPWSMEDAACLTDFIERMWVAKMEEQP